MKRTLATALAVVGFVGVAIAQEAPGPYGYDRNDVPATVSGNGRLFYTDPMTTSATDRHSIVDRQDVEPRFRWNEN